MFKDFDVFDLACALYIWLPENWQGQGDELYEDYCKLTAPGTFKAGFGLNTAQDLTYDEKYVYDMFTRDNYKEALERVLNYESSNF